MQIIPKGWQTEYNQLRRKSTSVLCCKRIQAELQNYTCNTCKDHLKWQQNKILLVRCAQVSKLFVCNGNLKHCHHGKSSFECWLGNILDQNLILTWLECFLKRVPAYLLFQSGPDTFFMKIWNLRALTEVGQNRFVS